MHVSESLCTWDIVHYCKTLFWFTSVLSHHCSPPLQPNAPTSVPFLILFSLFLCKAVTLTSSLYGIHCKQHHCHADGHMLWILLMSWDLRVFFHRLWKRFILLGWKVHWLMPHLALVKRDSVTFSGEMFDIWFIAFIRDVTREAIQVLSATFIIE